MTATEEDVDIAELYKINPSLLNTVLLNKLNQHLSKIRQMEARKVIAGQLDYISKTVTTTPTFIDFRLLWKTAQVINKGTDTALLTVFSLELITDEAKRMKEEFIERESPQIALDAYDDIPLGFTEDRLIGIEARAQNTTTKLKIVLMR